MQIVVNVPLNKRRFALAVRKFLWHAKIKHTSLLLQEMMSLGFEYGTRLGISLSPEDFKGFSYTLPLTRARQNFSDYSIPVGAEGCRSSSSRSDYSKSERARRAFGSFKTFLSNFSAMMPVPNSLYLLACTGARGNVSQIRQLIGYRGLVFNLKGRVCGDPIAGGLSHGLTLHEYFLSCYGARKGVIDTALRTAEAGYLTRKMVESTQKMTIRERQCVRPVLLRYPIGSNVSLIGSVKDPDCLILEGKYSGQDIIDPVSQTVILSPSVPLNKKFLMFVQAHNLTCLNFYSPLSCEGLVCQRCYGVERISGKTIRLGESVGTIAGQSIGEPATQLVLRTFHTGGIFESYGGQRVMSSANNLQETLPGFIPYFTLHAIRRDQTRSPYLTLLHRLHSRHLSCIFNFEQSTLFNAAQLPRLPIRNSVATLGSIAPYSNYTFGMALGASALSAFYQTGMCYHISDKASQIEPSWLCSSAPLRSLMRHHSWHKWTDVDSVSPLSSGELHFKNFRITLTCQDKGWGGHVLQHSLGRINQSFVTSFPGCYGFAVKSRSSGFGHTNYLGLQRLVSSETLLQKRHGPKPSHSTEQMWWAQRGRIFYVNSSLGLVSEKGRLYFVDSVHRLLHLVKTSYPNGSKGRVGFEKFLLARNTPNHLQYVAGFRDLAKESRQALSHKLTCKWRVSDADLLAKGQDTLANIVARTRTSGLLMVWPTIYMKNYMAGLWGVLFRFMLAQTKYVKDKLTAYGEGPTFTGLSHLAPGKPIGFVWSRQKNSDFEVEILGRAAELTSQSLHFCRKMGVVVSQPVDRTSLPSAGEPIPLDRLDMSEVLCARLDKEHGTSYVCTHGLGPSYGSGWEFYIKRSFSLIANLLVFKLVTQPLVHLKSFSRAYADGTYLSLRLKTTVEIATSSPPLPGFLDHSRLRQFFQKPSLSTYSYSGLANSYSASGPTFRVTPSVSGLKPHLFGAATSRLHEKDRYVVCPQNHITRIQLDFLGDNLRTESGPYHVSQTGSSYSSAYKAVVFSFHRKLTKLNFDPTDSDRDLSINTSALLQDAHSVIHLVPHTLMVPGRLTKLKCHSAGTAQTISAVVDYHYKPFLTLGSSTSQPGLRKSAGFTVLRASNLHRWAGENVAILSSLSHKTGTQISRGPVVRGRINRLISDWRRYSTEPIGNKMVYAKWLPWSQSLQLSNYPNNSYGGSGRDIIVGIQLIDAILENRLPLAKAAIARAGGVSQTVNLIRRSSTRIRRSLYDFQPFVPTGDYSSIAHSPHLHIFYSGQPVETGLASMSASISQVCEAQASFQGVFTANKLALLFGQQLLSRSLFRQYLFQGIKIPSVHFELIARRMASCVRVVALGQVHCSIGDIVPLGVIHMLNQAAIKHGYQSCSYRPVIIGVSKSVLLNTGFLSSASFQEPVEALTKLSIQSRLDWCMDLKARVMLGNIISSGTGMRSLTQTRARRAGWKPKIDLKHVFSSFRVFNRK